jgi:hypothetical protein
MNRLSTILISASLVFAAVVSAAAQTEEKPRPWGWDLTYSSLREKNRPDLPNMMNWLGQDLSYAISRVVDEWKGERIRSSVLVEMPSFRGSGTRSLWFVRTRSKAYFWEFGGLSTLQYQRTEIDKKHYDQLFRSLDSVRQSKPRVYQNPRMNWKGYYSALSTVNCVASNCPSKQILLTWEDFYPLDSTETRSAGPGPVAAALDRTFADMSATDLLLFRTCKDRPRLKDFTLLDEGAPRCNSGLFPDEVRAGGPSDSFSCYSFRGFTYRAEFASQGEASEMRIADRSFGGVHGLRPIIPTKSYFSMTLRNTRTPIVLPNPSLKYVISRFEDECVSIEFRGSLALTAVVEQGWRVRWKNPADK